jgi:hypothetical protein
MKAFFLIIFATFTLFFIEALTHFNIGRNGELSHNYWEINQNIKIHIPNTQETIKIALTVLFFSTLSAGISTYLIKRHT